MKSDEPKRRSRSTPRRTGSAPKEITAAIDAFVVAAKSHRVPADALVDAVASSILKIYGETASNARRAKAVSLLVERLRSAHEFLVHVDDAVLTAGRRVLTSDEAVVMWLCTPASFAGGRRPVELLQTPAGKQEVIGFLVGLSHGNFM